MEQVYPKQAKRLLNNPLTGLFVPSIVCGPSLGDTYMKIQLSFGCPRSWHLRRSSSAQLIMPYRCGMYHPILYTHSSGRCLPFLTPCPCIWGAVSCRLYVCFALLTCFPMLNIWFNKPHELANFTPVYAFLVRSPGNKSETQCLTLLIIV